MTQTTRFIRQLTDAVVRDPLRKTLLVAPSHRIGRQWLDQAAGLAGAIVNVHVAPLRRLLLDYSQPVLEGKRLRAARREELIRLVGMAVGELEAGQRDGYFTRLPPSMTFTETLLRSLEDLENAGIRGAAALAGKLVTPEKTAEMAGLLEKFRAAKRQSRVIGSSDVAAAALDGLAEKAADAVPFLLVPASIMQDAVGAEQVFLSRWPSDSMLILEEDEDFVPAAVAGFSADCVANEAREVMRRILDDNIPLDHVEAVCLDGAAYVDALCAAGVELFGGRVEELPFTFSGGIPAHFSRPVRLLRAWLAWRLDGLPPAGLADMLEAGLLGDEWQKQAPGVSAHVLAARIKALPLQAGLRDYLRALGTGDVHDDVRKAEKWLAATLQDIVPVADGDRPASPDSVLAAADRLLAHGSDNDGKLDAYARLAAREAIAAWMDCCDWPGFDAVVWLDSFASGLRVMGLGPQPGRMHISDGVSGGHTGRPVSFVLGMDEGRATSAVRQDPVLLDRERRGLSRHLQASGWRRERRERALRRLFGRLRGRVVLSWAQMDDGAGRTLYPSALFVKATGGQSGAGAASLRPERPGGCLNGRDDWLWTLLAARMNRVTPSDLAPWFPHLARGAAAETVRATEKFSEWDGHVPEAGEDFIREDWVLSPSQLELFARCPLDFFFRKALGIRKPDRWEPEPGRWLAGNERGQLLHDLFQDFMTELDNRQETVCMEHGLELMAMLDRAIKNWRKRVPVRDDFAYARDRRELTDAAAIFLVHESHRAGSGRPVCFEASIGGATEECRPWQRVEPVRIDCGDGVFVSLQGRIDRVDRASGNDGLIIWDYKTGKSSDFSQNDPFAGGRHLQSYLYTVMLEQALGEIGMPERVREFCYFFPMSRDEGDVKSYARDDLRGGMEVVRPLVDLLRSGCFPASSIKDDLRYSDYGEMYGALSLLMAQARKKAATNECLEPWRKLRSKKME